MKPKRVKTSKYPGPRDSSLMFKEAVSLPGVGVSVSVRVAKAKLSALLELVAGGQVITITSSGKPKAVLTPVGKSKGQRVFTGMGDYLMNQPVQRKGPFADEIIRVERDSRP